LKRRYLSAPDAWRILFSAAFSGGPIEAAVALDGGFELFL